MSATDKVVKEDDESWTIEKVKVRPTVFPTPDAPAISLQLKPGALWHISVC